MTGEHPNPPKPALLAAAAGLHPDNVFPCLQVQSPLLPITIQSPNLPPVLPGVVETKPAYQYVIVHFQCISCLIQPTQPKLQRTPIPVIAPLSLCASRSDQLIDSTVRPPTQSFSTEPIQCFPSMVFHLSANLLAFPAAKFWPGRQSMPSSTSSLTNSLKPLLVLACLRAEASSVFSSSRCLDPILLLKPAASLDKICSC